ncbi:hypothetical protein ACQY0O_007978 [Thecaphora frezii]
MKEKSSKDKRRQYRSCDRCRSGKRACDASYASVAEALERKVACSNCKKKGKACSFQYVLSILGGPGFTTAALQPPGGTDASESPTAALNTDPDETCSLESDELEPVASNDHITNAAVALRYSRISADLDAAQPEPSSDAHTDASDAGAKVPSDHAAALVHHVGLPRAADPVAVRPYLPPKTVGTSRSLTGWDMGWDRARHNVLQCLQGVSFQSASSRLATNLDRIYLNDGLIRVYEGAAEQALRCWVTSSNTPYMLERLSHPTMQGHSPNHQLVYWRICELDRGSRSLLGRGSPSEDVEVMEAFHAVILAFAAQWAPHWIRGLATQDSPDPTAPHGGGGEGSSPRFAENRIRLALWKRARDKLQAVCSLDSFRVIFSLIIFAWTEKPREIQERASARVDMDLTDESCALDTSSWQSPAEGSTLLLVAALRKLLSIRFKVESKKRRGLLPWDPLSRSGARTGATAAADRVERTRGRPDGGEEGREMQRGLEEKRQVPDATASTNNHAAVRADEVKRMEGTYHMLYWLGVVIDTETAVLRKHPPVVSDEDSEVLRSVPCGDTHWGDDPAGGGGTKGIWDDYIVDYSKKKTSELASVWPCDEAKASATLSFSTPVKVVLFRQISRLQMSFWRRASVENVEQHIASGLGIVRHWQQVYAPLLDSCRRHHATLPPSIQSWYVLIACPWYLAVLLFVEMVQTIDMAGSCDHRCRAERARSGTFPQLRDQACADMAAMIETIQATEFAHGGTFDFVRDSGGTVLHTEPWTEILVHSISAVAKTEIRQHDGLCAQFRWHELEASRRRVHKCLWALEQLSDRSPSASMAFEQLSNLAHTRTKQQFHIEQIPMASPMLPDSGVAADPHELVSVEAASSLTPSSLVQALEDFQNQSFATASDDEVQPTSAETSCTSANHLLNLLLSRQQPTEAAQDQTRDSMATKATAGAATFSTGCDLEQRSGASHSSLDSTAAASRLFCGSNRRPMRAAWPGAASSTTSAKQSSIVSSGKRRYAAAAAEPDGAIDDAHCIERPRKVPRYPLPPSARHREAHATAAAAAAPRESCHTFFSPPLQDRPTQRDEAQMDEEEFYVDGRADEMLEQHRLTKARASAAAAKRQEELCTSAASTAEGAGDSCWLDAAAAEPVISECDVDWSSIFGMPM